MSSYPIPIYTSGIRFLIWLWYLSGFRHSDKNGYGFHKIIHHISVGAHQTELFSNKYFLYIFDTTTKAAIVLSTFNFTNCYCYGLMGIFFNFGFYYDAVKQWFSTRIPQEVTQIFILFYDLS